MKLKLSRNIVPFRISLCTILIPTLITVGVTTTLWISLTKDPSKSTLRNGQQMKNSNGIITEPPQSKIDIQSLDKLLKSDHTFGPDLVQSYSKDGGDFTQKDGLEAVVKSGVDEITKYDNVDAGRVVEKDTISRYANNEDTKSSIDTVAIGFVSTIQFHSENANVSSLPFMDNILPSICDDLKQNDHQIHFYIGYYKNDSLIKSSKDTFYSIVKNSLAFNCFNLKSKTLKQVTSLIKIHFVECESNTDLAQAENKVMMAAYMDNIDYYLRVHENSTIDIKGSWFSAGKYWLDDERNKIGIVGPVKEENHIFFNHFLVSRSHIDIFGFFYPPNLDIGLVKLWICRVYRPNYVSTDEEFLMEVRGSEPQGNITDENYKILEAEIIGGMQVLKRYATSRFDVKKEMLAGANTMAMVISKSSLPRKWNLILRNLQLQSVMYPNWKMNLYFTTNVKENIPQKYIKKAKILGAKVGFLDQQSVKCPFLWVIKNHSNQTDFMIVHNADKLISDEDAIWTLGWENSNKPYFFLNERNGTSVSLRSFGVHYKNLKNSSSSQLFNQITNTKNCSNFDDFLLKDILPKRKDMTFSANYTFCQMAHCNPLLTRLLLPNMNITENATQNPDQ